jgi:hypothetical protein
MRGETLLMQATELVSVALCSELSAVRPLPQRKNMSDLPSFERRLLRHSKGWLLAWLLS